MIQERGLVQTVEFEVNKTIQDNKWELLCEHPDSTVVPMAREFYANGKERDNFMIFVRGKWVFFDQTIINQFYGLENIDNDEYHPLIEKDDTNWDDIKMY